MISALVIRRFAVKQGDVAHVVEAARLLDLPALPMHGWLLVFDDGTGAAGVSAMRMHGWPSPRPTGVYPVAVEIRTGAEPGERLEAAVAAGWAKLSPAMQEVLAG